MGIEIIFGFFRSKQTDDIIHAVFQWLQTQLLFLLYFSALNITFHLHKW